MKMILILLGFCLCFQQIVYAGEQIEHSGNVSNAVQEEIAKPAAPFKVDVYSEKGLFGLKSGDKIITEPVYNKMIKLGMSSWIILYKGKYGILSQNGEILLTPKYRNVDRFFDKYAKLGNYNDYGLYDETGKTIIPPEYSSIDMLYGNMFLTCKNYKYGITDINGNVILDNMFDDIYMPKPNVIMVQYNGKWISIEKISDGALSLPKDVKKISEDKDFKITDVVVNTGVASGYSVVTLTDYVLKLLSSVSPAYESTIDELMYSQGADTINILVKFSWVPKFPITYLRNYYRLVRHPNEGPLASTRKMLKRQMK